MKYLLGVDGGNTKTDYFLFSSEGVFLDHHRAGTCSHENMDDSYEGAYRVMKQDIDVLLSRNELTTEDIDAAAFGLAGCDVEEQHQELCKVCERLGFKKFVVVNDSTIGLKAGTTHGYGISCVNGTGTSNSGIDKFGKVLQVGGIGELTSDRAGGHFLAREVVKAVYNEAFRCGEKTSLTDIVFKNFNITSKYDLMDAITHIFKRGHFNYTIFTIALFEEAAKGDKVARSILEEMADTLAYSGAGLIKELSLDEPEVALVGSVWVKGAWKGAISRYKETIERLVGRPVQINLVKVPPATGAIIWAKELLDGKFPTIEMRDKIIKEVEDKLD